MSLIRIVRMEFYISRVPEFLQFFETKRDTIANQPGCIQLQLFKDANFDNVFYTFSTWEQEIDLENYRRSAFFKETWSKTKLWFCAKAQAFSFLPFNQWPVQIATPSEI